MHIILNIVLNNAIMEIAQDFEKYIIILNVWSQTNFMIF